VASAIPPCRRVEIGQRRCIDWAGRLSVSTGHHPCPKAPENKRLATIKGPPSSVARRLLWIAYRAVPAAAIGSITWAMEHHLGDGQSSRWTWVLAVGFDEPVDDEPTADVGTHYAASARSAIDVLRLMSFDLLLVNAAGLGADGWEWVARVRAAWPRQRWALVAPGLRDAEEIRAREAGAVRIFAERPPAWQLSDWIRGLRGVG
jgi:hypothetical protein